MGATPFRPSSHKLQNPVDAPPLKLKHGAGAIKPIPFLFFRFFTVYFSSPDPATLQNPKTTPKTHKTIFHFFLLYISSILPNFPPFSTNPSKKTNRRTRTRIGDRNHRRPAPQILQDPVLRPGPYSSRQNFPPEEPKILMASSIRIR